MSEQSTLKAVAHRVGISISTVSRVLNESPHARIAPDTRRRVWQTARELNYRRQPLQMRFVSSVPTERPGTFQRLHVLAAAQREADRHQISLPMVFAGETAEQQLECVERMADSGVDGLLVVAPLAPAVRDRLNQLRMPAVFVGSALRDPRFTCVHSDNEQGTVLLFDHLRDLGHSRSAFCGRNPQRFYEDQRHPCVPRRVRARRLPAPGRVELLELQVLGGPRDLAGPPPVLSLG